MKRDDRPDWRDGLVDLGSLFLEPDQKNRQPESGPMRPRGNPALASEAFWQGRRAQTSGEAPSPRRNRPMNERKTPRDILDELLEGGRAAGSHDGPDPEGLDRLTRRQLPPEEPSVSRDAALAAKAANSELAAKAANAELTAKAANAELTAKAANAGLEKESADDVPFLFLNPTAPAGEPEAPAPIPAPASPEAPAIPAKSGALRTGSKPKKARPAAKKEAGKRSRKKKTTHYLSKETFDELSKAKKAIRRIAPREVKTGVSKSLIVDSALKLLLEDFENNGERSQLVKTVLAARDKS